MFELVNEPWRIPSIDIAPYREGGHPAERAAVARAMDEANVTIGFVQISGHGIPDEVIARLGSAIDAF